MKILAERHSVGLYCMSLSDPIYRAQRPNLDHYVESLRKEGVVIEEGKFSYPLQSGAYDVLFFEFYETASFLLDQARVAQPSARMIVDSIDVHFRRLLAKASLTRRPEDLREAKQVKKEELEAYRAADVVVTVSEADRQFLLSENNRMRVEILPLIYSNCESLPHTTRVPNSLLFVGNFNHEPNADAIRYFCGEILPLIASKRPNVKVTIIGSDPPQEIRAAASSQLEVLGHVPDLNPYLQSSWVSIAPVRFGAGMNGKVGEAMAFGLPVVTTSVGAEGFGASSGEGLLLADTAAEFADSVLRLLEDAELHARLAKNGQVFIKQHFSEEALRPFIFGVFDRFLECKPKRASIRSRFLPKFKYHYDRYIGWRINRHHIAKTNQ
jgi:glycosyltransferase involved in cell wall biosynthesis